MMNNKKGSLASRLPTVKSMSLPRKSKNSSAGGGRIGSAIISTNHIDEDQRLAGDVLPIQLTGDTKRIRSRNSYERKNPNHLMSASDHDIGRGDRGVQNSSSSMRNSGSCLRIPGSNNKNNTSQNMPNSKEQILMMATSTFNQPSSSSSSSAAHSSFGMSKHRESKMSSPKKTGGSNIGSPKIIRPDHIPQESPRTIARPNPQDGPRTIARLSPHGSPKTAPRSNPQGSPKTIPRSSPQGSPRVSRPSMCEIREGAVLQVPESLHINNNNNNNNNSKNDDSDNNNNNQRDCNNINISNFSDSSLSTEVDKELTAGNYFSHPIRIFSYQRLD